MKILFEEGTIRRFVKEDKWDGIIKMAIARHSDYSLQGITDERELLSHYSRMLPSAGCEEVGLTSFGYNDVFKMEVANGFFYENGATITLK